MSKNRLKQLREQRGLSLEKLQNELKNKVDLKISSDSLSRYELFQRNPKPETWKKLADFYGVSVPYLQGAYSKEEIIEFYNEYLQNTFDLAGNLTKNVIDKLEEQKKINDELFMKLISSISNLIQAYLVVSIENSTSNSFLDWVELTTEPESSRFYTTIQFYYFIGFSRDMYININIWDERFFELSRNTFDRLQKEDKNFLISILQTNNDEDKKLKLAFYTINKIISFNIELDKTKLKLKKDSKPGFLFLSRLIKWLLQYPNLDVSKKELFEIFEEITLHEFNSYLST